MAVKKGRIVDRKLYVEVDGKKHMVPDACAEVKAEQLAAFTCTEVEVLMAKDTVLAIRALNPRLVAPWPPIITCYLIGPDIVFDDLVMREIEPVITKTLVESGRLSGEVAEQLGRWKKEYG